LKGKVKSRTTTNLPTTKNSDQKFQRSFSDKVKKRYSVKPNAESKNSKNRTSSRDSSRHSSTKSDKISSSSASLKRRRKVVQNVNAVDRKEP